MSARHPDVVVRRAEARDAEALRAIFDAPGAMAGERTVGTRAMGEAVAAALAA